jgi:aspartyl-tRNA(Asn)/glutamyl-tRNA(Gln) amidotransferase subunit B
MVDWETVIGLEAHVQLKTRTKLFCGCRVAFGEPENSLVCPVCLGHPGVLPVLNRAAVEHAVTAGLALGCRINRFTKFDRKNYHYPDLPKNYQISQYDIPVCAGGHLNVDMPDGSVKRVGLTRIHIEEDAGKNIHDAGGTSVDLNRTGTPLAEIVTEPDMRTPEEAGAYLRSLARILTYLGVSDCQMQEGTLRCDANVSVRPIGETRLGVKNEIKNMNSFRGVEKALALVRDRLIAKAEAGERIVQATWGYSVDADRVYMMRTKEFADDYRYFPEPDLPPVTIDDAWLERLRGRVGELPNAKRARYTGEWELPPRTADDLAARKSVAEYFEAAVAAGAPPRAAANWVTQALFAAMNAARRDFDAGAPVPPAALAEMIRMIDGGVINNHMAKDRVFPEMFATGRSAAAIVGELGLASAGAGDLRAGVRAVLESKPPPLADFLGGKAAALNALVGLCMKRFKGKADPDAVRKAIMEETASMK